MLLPLTPVGTATKLEETAGNSTSLLDEAISKIIMDGGTNISDGILTGILQFSDKKAQIISPPEEPADWTMEVEEKEVKPEKIPTKIQILNSDSDDEPESRSNCIKMIMLLSDGSANAGIQDPVEMVQAAQVSLVLSSCFRRMLPFQFSS